MYSSTYGNTRPGDNYRNNNDFLPINPNAPKLIDTIQEISWLPRQNELVFACATWEGLLRFYGIVSAQNQYGIDFFFHIILGEPVICCDFRADGNSVFCGLGNGLVVEVDVASKQFRTIGQHDQCVRHVFWSSYMNLLISVGYDKYIRFWDIMSPGRPSFEFKCDNIPLSAATYQNFMAYYDNENQVNEADFDKIRMMSSTSKLFMLNRTGPTLGLTSQITSMAITQDRLFIGSIDGRVHVSKYSTRDVRSGGIGYTHQITFKAHKTDESVPYSSVKRSYMWPVSGIQPYQPRQSDWISTQGGEGVTYLNLPQEVILWDMKEKQKITTLALGNGHPVTAGKLSPDGVVLVWGTGHDWHKGMEHCNRYQPQIVGYKIPDSQLRYDNVHR